MNKNLARCLDRPARQLGKVVELPISFKPRQDVADGIRAMQKDYTHLSWGAICNSLLAEELKKYGYLKT